MLKAHVHGYDLIKTIDPDALVGVAQHILAWVKDKA